MSKSKYIKREKGGDFNAENKRVISLGDPIGNKDGVNKEWVEELTTKVTKILYVDINRLDSYIENGSIIKPYKTIQAAVVVANGNVLINVAPGEYSGDIDLGLHVVGIRGSGINATIFTGNITAGDRAHSLDEFRIKSTGSLTITDNIFARNLHLQCAVIVSGSGFLDGHNIYLAPDSGVVPLTVTSTGGVMANEISIVAQGNVHAINQSAGTIVLFHSYAKNSSLTISTINSSGGIIGLIDTSIYNVGFGIAVSMDNGGSVLTANTLSGIVCSGNIVCGSATTYVEGLNFVGFGALSGSALVYRPASRIDNDSLVIGNTVKDALETLDGKIPKDNVTTFSCPAITIADGENIQIYRFTTNLNAKIKIWSAGLSALGGGQLANSYIQIYNETDGQVEYQTNDRFVSGSPASELSLSQKDISIRAINGTGVAVDLHAFITITQE